MLHVNALHCTDDALTCLKRHFFLQTPLAFENKQINRTPGTRFASHDFVTQPRAVSVSLSCYCETITLTLSMPLGIQDCLPKKKIKFIQKRHKHPRRTSTRTPKTP